MSYTLKIPSKAHIGHNVSHAKNRTKRVFRHNLHTVTVLIDGQKHRMKVPTKMLRMLKNTGATTHFKKAE